MGDRQRWQIAVELGCEHQYEIENMAKQKKKLSAEVKRRRKKTKAENQKKYEWVFMSGKQVRIRRQPTIDGIPVDEYIERNADPVWLQQNGLYELIPDVLNCI